jgi:hypothetical protein
MRRTFANGSMRVTVLGLTLGMLVITAVGAEKKSSKSEPQKQEAAPASSAAKVDLNSASQEELEKVQGIGPATAKKIIAGRPYSSVGDLAKAGVSASTIKKIGPAVTVGAAPAAAPKPTPPPVPAQTKTKESASKTSKTAEAPTPAQPPPAKGMVWVNLDTKVFHREGDRWYGKTKHGKYMTESDAVKAGYTEAKTGGKKSQ